MSDSVFLIVKSILSWVNSFFVVYLIGYSTFLFLSVVIGSSELYKRRRQDKLKNTLFKNYYVPISIIVPAYNEALAVVSTVESLLDLDYKLYEIIVVDDGSKDDTSGELIAAFDMHPIRRPIQRKIECQPDEFVYEAICEKVPLTLIRKKNGGRADALNMGINACKYPYFICIGAGSVLPQDSLSRIIRPVLEHQNVVAVGGVVRPANGVTIEHGRAIKYKLPRNLLACMQVLEYDRSFLASRILFDKFGGSLLISGTFGLFKKDAVIAAGGYDTSTMGEDMELIVKLHEYCTLNDIPYCVKYATDAVCWSRVPENLRDLCRQRKRCHLGLFQSVWKHRRMLFDPKYGAVSFVSFLCFLIYVLLSPFIEILGAVSIVASFFTGLLNIRSLIMIFAVYTVFGCVLTMTAFFARMQTVDLKVRATDALRAILICFIEVTFFRFIMLFIRSTAFFGYKKKKLTQENKRKIGV